MYDSLSPKMRKVASYLVDHHKEAVFLTASSLAKKAGVSETTVTRLAYALDFHGYPELRRALQEHTKDYMALPRFQPKSPGGYILGEVAEMESLIIKETLVTISPELFNKAADLLYKARRVIVVGTHYNIAPADYAANFFSAVRKSVGLIKEIGIQNFSEAQSAGSTDVVLAISTARYPKDTGLILELFKAKGTQVIVITDSEVAPVVPLADLLLVVPMKFISFIDPFAGILVLLHSLVTAVYVKNEEKGKKWVKDYNDFMEHNNYNSIKDINLFDLL
jgi:DNA-binding MurR/RpiR family transcriptional regulator